MPRVVLIAYDGAQGLDLFGPAEVFAAAGAYDVVVAAARRRIVTGSGVAITPRLLSSLRPRRGDTVLVVGGDEAAVRGAIAAPAIVAFVRRAAPVVQRIGSVCSGAFVLAAAGVLDGRRAATHWSACARLAKFRPAVRVDPEAIYVRDGRVWTSAGVTTGIDMALAMVEVDHGRALADSIAGRLVLYARRPGFQSQWSSTLVAQQDAGAPLRPVIAWVRDHVRHPIDIATLARRAAMSSRTLHRRCLAELAITPRQLVEKVRVEEARLLLHTTQLPAKAIAARCGFVDSGQLARAFVRTLGMTPHTCRELANASRRTALR